MLLELAVLLDAHILAYALSQGSGTAGFFPQIIPLPCTNAFRIFSSTLLLHA